ncbi:hypothetical protein [Prevotella sp. HCN-7019]|uniref:hypothetical protein n=1 Tax=Prevotella sp. HCN-7019 TaxID=3134668 RepID=UPI00262D2E0C
MSVLWITLTGVLLLVAGLIWSRMNIGGTGNNDNTASSCATCDGTSAKCEQECMMEAATKEIEYFDDEELDKFAGRQSDSYDQEEVEQFCEVLHTMRQDEVQAWCRSLTLRGISLPDELKDEVIMLIDDEHS